jgi:hypothetical protein
VLAELLADVKRSGIDLDAPLTTSGHTPLQITMVFGSELKCRALLDAGASLSSCGAHGLNPVQLATRLGRQQLAIIIGAQASRTMLQRIAEARRAAAQAAASSGTIKKHPQSP